MTEIDPDAESTKDPGESSKGFGEHMKDAVYDLKEDVKDAARREKGGGGDENSEDEEGRAGE